jgi:SAM-dependent methyltransferase
MDDATGDRDVGDDDAGGDGTVAWDFLPSSYDTVATKYESRFEDELDGKPRDRELLEALARTAEDAVADIGCGPGQIGAFVRQRGRRVVGLDLSPEMARLAKLRLDAALVADMRALPLGTDSMGGLVAFYAVIHLRRAELGTALREFRRVLRPGGRVLLSAHEGTGVVELDEFLQEPVPFAATLFGLDELVAAVHGAGLEVTVAERRPPYATEGTTVRLYVEARKR